MSSDYRAHGTDALQMDDNKKYITIQEMNRIRDSMREEMKSIKDTIINEMRLLITGVAPTNNVKPTQSVPTTESDHHYTDSEVTSSSDNKSHTPPTLSDHPSPPRGISILNESLPSIPVSMSSGRHYPSQRQDHHDQDDHRDNHRHDRYAKQLGKANHPPAPVDTNQKLPSKIDELPSSNVTPDVYNRWAIRTLGSIKGLTKYEGIIDKPPDTSWDTFKKRNSKYPPYMLQQHYLDTHRATFGFIIRGLDTNLGIRMEEKLREDSQLNNLTHHLNFDSYDAHFYENANALWEMIRSHYVMKTPFRLDSILRDLSSIRYNGTEDPKYFISKYQQIHSQGKLLITSFPEFSDDIRAMDILSKLPLSPTFDNLKAIFFHRDTTISVREVEDVLRHWWTTQQSRKRTATKDRDTEEFSSIPMTDDDSEIISPPNGIPLYSQTIVSAHGVTHSRGRNNQNHSRDRRDRRYQSKSPVRHVKEKDTESSEESDDQRTYVV
jgi:hypothetical protein